jgi:ATP-binding cassette subfamily F protein 3
MLLNLQSIGKTLGNKRLYDNLSLTVREGEKVGMIGRNGIGKTTLLGIMAGTDLDYTGTIDRRRGLIVTATSQEHLGIGTQKVLDYVLENLPEYKQLHQIIETYPDMMGDDMTKITEYTEALNRFGELGYYDIADRARNELTAFQIGPEFFDHEFRTLSGGQKRLVDLVKVTLSDCDLALIDEPTNHMDYVAKAAFIKWLQSTEQAIIVITHDRDVLGAVDRIIEIKDTVALSFKGNYDAYLVQNGDVTSKAITSYEYAQRRIIKLEKQIVLARTRKAGWNGTADKTNPFMLLEKRLTKELDELRTSVGRPDFWIDQETVDQMKDTVVAKYERYKSKNISVGMRGKHRQFEILDIRQLQLGFNTSPLFKPISFDLDIGERMELYGRNGAGKSTLVKAIRNTAAGSALESIVFDGTIKTSSKISIGSYEQEIDERYLPLTLAAALFELHIERGIPVTEQRVKQLLADYLFDPTADGRLTIAQLSGGQKARFQLIAMLCHNPNLLILDEPTNHLDLPSIEELEKALARYEGAVLYISHDSYFVKNVGGERIMVAA